MLPSAALRQPVTVIVPIAGFCAGSAGDVAFGHPEGAGVGAGVWADRVRVLASASAPQAAKTELFMAYHFLYLTSQYASAGRQ